MADRAKKRRHPEDDFHPSPTLSPPLAQRRARFPKGKTAKSGDERLPVDGGGGDDLDNWMDPLLAAKECAKRRNRTREDELFGPQENVSSAEVRYEFLAKGYEHLARARVDKTSNTKSVVSELNQGKAIFSDGKRHGEQESSIWDLDPGPSAVNVCAQQASPGDGGDKFDMFGDDDESATKNLSASNTVNYVSAFQQAYQPTSARLDSSQNLDSVGN